MKLHLTEKESDTFQHWCFWMCVFGYLFLFAKCHGDVSGATYLIHP